MKRSILGVHTGVAGLSLYRRLVLAACCFCFGLYSTRMWVFCLTSFSPVLEETEQSTGTVKKKHTVTCCFVVVPNTHAHAHKSHLHCTALEAALYVNKHSKHQQYWKYVLNGLPHKCIESEKSHFIGSVPLIFTYAHTHTYTVDKRIPKCICRPKHTHTPPPPALTRMHPDPKLILHRMRCAVHYKCIQYGEPASIPPFRITIKPLPHSCVILVWRWVCVCVRLCIYVCCIFICSALLASIERPLHKLANIGCVIALRPLFIACLCSCLAVGVCVHANKLLNYYYSQPISRVLLAILKFHSSKRKRISAGSHSLKHSI